MKAGITLEIRTGYHGEKVRHFDLVLDELTTRALMEPVELSNDPFSLRLSSPQMSAVHSVQNRGKVFKMREHFAKDIADQLITCLIQAFGQEDITDRYSQSEINRFNPHPAK